MYHEEKTPQGNMGSDLMVWMAIIGKASRGWGPSGSEGLGEAGSKGWEGAQGMGQERLEWARSLGAT